MFRTRSAQPIWASGPRPHTQAGHMTAIDQTRPISCTKSLQPGGRPHMRLAHHPTLTPAFAGAGSGAGKDSSKMAIGRTEDRDTPRNPLMLRHRVYVQDPIRATHLGQRSPTAHIGRTHDRNRPDPSRQLHKILATRGPSTHGFRARRCAAPRNDGVIYGLLCKAGWRPAMTDYLGSGILGAAQGQSAREVPMASFPLVSATGMLGSGYRAESLDT